MWTNTMSSNENAAQNSKLAHLPSSPSPIPLKSPHLDLIETFFTNIYKSR